MTDRAGPSSASSSLAIASKADQVVYRVYLKTVSVLTDARLTHYAGATTRSGDRKQDRWFNIITPEVDVHRADLKMYQSISAYPTSRVPPLLLAFVLDTSDLPNGQALLWNRAGVKVPLDTGLIGKGKGKERGGAGIVLERWTFQARTPHLNPASSQQAAPQAYRLGIIHFRALFSLIRLLPAYRLSRRLRRANTGLRIGINLWAPEDTPPEALPEAWAIMERGQLGLDTGLDELAVGASVDAEQIETHAFPPLDLFGTEYHLGVQYRPDIDFLVEDMESVLSEKLVEDMEEDWFTPTVARHRLESEARAAAPIGKGERRSSGPAPIPNPSPIPQRQGPASYGSFRGSVGKARASGGTPGSLSKWGALAEGLPFAAPAQSPTLPPSPLTTTPSGAAITARRLSGHYPTGTSPNASLRGPPRPALGSSKPSSIGRTSSFLSQSGRSFTHAQLASMGGMPIGSASPPVTGAMSQLGEAGSLSFSKQSVPRSLSGRPPFATYQSGSPIIPGSLEREGAGSPGGPSQLMKRYSSYSARRERLAGSPTAQPGSQGSSGGDGSIPGSVGGQGLLRRTSTRASYESSSLRRSLGDSGGSGSKMPQADQDDIEAFLKTLEALPQPPTVAAQAAHASRTYLPSTSSSLSNPSGGSGPTASMQASAAEPLPGRAPMTKTQVDDALRRMAGSFNHVTASMMDPAFGPSPRLRSTATSGSGTPSVGLLSASRPLSSPRKVPTPEGMSRRTSGGVKPGSIGASSPLAREGYRREPSVPPAPEPEVERAEQRERDRSAESKARSLPGAGVAVKGKGLDDSRPLLSAGVCPPGAALSPQTTGGQESAPGSLRSRRGPVLLRGGFESRDRERERERERGESSSLFGRRERRDKTSVSSSPSHSPIRDFGRLALRDNRERDVMRDRAGFRERQAEEELDNWARSAPGASSGYGAFGMSAGPAGTAGGAQPGVADRAAAGVLGRYRSLGLPGAPGLVGTGGESTGGEGSGVQGTGARRATSGGGQTAPSSLGAGAAGDADRGRRGQVRSDGETPADRAASRAGLE